MVEIKSLETALQTYGVVGMISVGIFWIAYRFAIHLIERDRERDRLVISMTEKFSDAMRADAVAKERLSLAIDESIRASDRQAAQNRDEHGQILEYVARRAK